MYRLVAVSTLVTLSMISGANAQHAQTAAPTITEIKPASVPMGWSGSLVIHGAGFTKDAYVLVDGRVPSATYVSETRLDADIKAEDTKTAGPKAVKVHLTTGDISNEVTLTVTKQAKPKAK